MRSFFVVAIVLLALGARPAVAQQANLYCQNAAGAFVPVSPSAPCAASDANNASFTRWPTVASGAAFPAQTRAWAYIATGTTTAVVTNATGDSKTLTLYNTNGFPVMTPEIPSAVTLGTPANCILYAYW